MIKTKTYSYDSPVYDKCTIFYDERRAIGVIQQRYNARLKCTFWGPIDREFVDLIMENENFQLYFKENAVEPSKNGHIETITIRQLLRRLGIKASKKEPWETRF